MDRRNIKAVVSYDGTDFVGWQVQNEGRTIQGVLEDALARIHDHPVSVNGAGRTDSGVHAAGQVFNFYTDRTGMGADRFALAINRLIPADVRVHFSEEVPIDFDSRRHARLREYRYYILPGRVVLPYYRRYCHGVYYRPDLRRLNGMASMIVGAHDFTSFAALNDPNNSKFRNIYSAAFFPEGPFLVFRITGSSFLWRMVRNLVGTLLALGEEESPPERFRDILLARDPLRSGMTAPARGLFLHKVAYEKDDERGVY